MSDPHNTWAGLKQPAFSHYFWSSTLGALTDNLFKNLVVLLLVYQSLRYGLPWPEAVLANVVAGLFIVPFALFSGLGGVLANRVEPSLLFVRLKWMELTVMALAGVGFMLNAGWLLLGCVLLMGVQSALYGPLKYAYLPKVLKPAELMAGNASVETATFMAILLGTVGAGLLLAATDAPHWQVLAILLCSGLGVWQAMRIPALLDFSKPVNAPPWHWALVYTSVVQAWRDTTEQLAVRRSVLAISTFWFTGALVLGNLPALGKNHLDMDELGLAALLAVFSVGVGLGSFLAEKFSGRQVEIGLVPLGALGMVVGLLGLWHAVVAPVAQPVDRTWPFGVWLAFLGMAGGLFVVPLYAVVQLRAPREKIASVIAFLNIQNSVFMVLAAILAVGLLSLNMPLPSVLLAAALFNVLVCLVVFQTVPEFLARFVVFLLVHTFYRYRVKGFHNFPETGAAYITPNHISWVDAFVVSAACRRPFSFVMYYKIFNVPVVNWFFKAMRAIPIAGRSEDEAVYNSAILEIQKRIQDGQLVCIFPEGAISRDGKLAPFKPGLLKMLELAPAPVVPVGIGRMWGSAFSRKHTNMLKRLPLWDYGRPVVVRAGAPLAPETVTMEQLQQRVATLSVMT
jgi:1-acyl-sn-glycerol-3-phosphate acyltransferase